jgi:hypothetical protein
LRIVTHTKTGNNTGSFGTRTNNTTTHTKLKITLEVEVSELEPITQQLTQKLKITLEASELESITLKERKLEVVLILEEQIQLMLTRVRDKVSRSSIYTAKILLETPMLESWHYHCYCHVREMGSGLRSKLSVFHWSVMNYYPSLYHMR